MLLACVDCTDLNEHLRSKARGCVKARDPLSSLRGLACARGDAIPPTLPGVCSPEDMVDGREAELAGLALPPGRPVVGAQLMGACSTASTSPLFSVTMPPDHLTA